MTPKMAESTCETAKKPVSGMLGRDLNAPPLLNTMRQPIETLRLRLQLHMVWCFGLVVRCVGYEVTNKRRNEVSFTNTPPFPTNRSTWVFKQGWEQLLVSIIWVFSWSRLLPKIFVLAIGLCLDFGTSSVLAALKLVLYRLGFEECQKKSRWCLVSPHAHAQEQAPPKFKWVLLKMT